MDRCLFLMVIALISILFINADDEIYFKKPNKVCIVPEHPENGFYSNFFYTYIPGTIQEIIYLNVTCNPTYNLKGDAFIFCGNGTWSTDPLPTCVRGCKVEESLGVVYRCVQTNLRGSNETRNCNELEAEGTVIEPECRRPHYYSVNKLQNMVCENGEWNYQPKCLPECGTLTPKAVPLIVGGSFIDRGDVPWHAAIYLKDSTIYAYICGGSMISETVILSAAHCFWQFQGNYQLPASRFAAAVGKIYSEWNSTYDTDAQTSDVKEIHMAKFFHGFKTLFQNDLAVVVVETPFVYQPYIRPVCLDFRKEFDNNQLQGGKIGKVAGWGLTTGYKGSETSRLKVLEMPFVPFDTCVEETPDYFAGYLTADKFCAGYKNGTALCKGDSGGGLAFPAKVHKVKRFFLRGIVSVSPPSQGDGKSCNLYELTAFSKVIDHEIFIRNYWSHDNQGQREDSVLVVPKKCILPTYPEHGSYIALGNDKAKPGQSFQTIALNYTCSLGYYLDNNNILFCHEGTWYGEIPKCELRNHCGIHAPKSRTLEEANGEYSYLPWHAGIYAKKNNVTLNIICGGSLVSTTVIISAAHCFWNKQLENLKGSEYGIAVGRLYHDWKNLRDTDAQKSEAYDVRIPSSYNPQIPQSSDLAVVIVKTPFQYNSYVGTICLDFDLLVDQRHLQAGRLGIVPTWSSIFSPAFNVAQAPIMDSMVCSNLIESGHFNRSDNFCAVLINGTKLCLGDSGNGLALSDNANGVERYYLRGVTSFGKGKYCGSENVFTHVIEHKDFIKQFL